MKQVKWYGLHLLACGTIGIMGISLPVSLWGCTTSDSSMPSDTNIQPSVSDTSSVASESQQSVSGTVLEDHTTIESGLKKSIIPVVSAIPQGRTTEEVTDVVFNAVVKESRSHKVRSVELLESHFVTLSDNTMQGMLANYIVHLEDADDFGIELSCSSAAEPIAQVKNLLRVSDTRLYDVATGQYVANEDKPESHETDVVTDATPPDSSESSESPYQRVDIYNEILDDYVPYYVNQDGTLEAVTETSPTPPETLNRMVEITDKDGNSHWIVAPSSDDG